MSDQDDKGLEEKLSDDELEKIGVGKKQENEADQEEPDFENHSESSQENELLDSGEPSEEEGSRESLESKSENLAEPEAESSPTIDEGDPGQPEANQEAVSSNNDEVLERLASLSVDVKTLATRDFEQLETAKKLIFTLSGITAIVLVASITFFVVMASSVSQKIGELDRVLMAVAKRGIQLADGIETVTEMEVSVLEVMDQNSLILADLSLTQEKIETLRNQFEKSTVSNMEALSLQTSDLSTSFESKQGAVIKRIESLDAKMSGLVDMKELVASQKAIESQVRSMKNMVLKLEENVNDLYAIRQAEVESVYQDLMKSQSSKD